MMQSKNMAMNLMRVWVQKLFENYCATLNLEEEIEVLREDITDN